MHFRRLKGVLCARNSAVSMGDVQYKVAEAGKERNTRASVSVHAVCCYNPKHSCSRGKE